MTHQGRKRGRLHCLWDESPNCFFCGRSTVLVIDPPRAPLKEKVRRRAVLLNLLSRLDPGRHELPRDGESRTVLSCLACAEEYSRRRQAGEPVENLHLRSEEWRRILYVWVSQACLPDREGQECRIVERLEGDIRVFEFADGYRKEAPRRFVRKTKKRMLPEPKEPTC